VPRINHPDQLHSLIVIRPSQRDQGQKADLKSKPRIRHSDHQRLCGPSLRRWLRGRCAGAGVGGIDVKIIVLVMDGILASRPQVIWLVGDQRRIMLVVRSPATFVGRWLTPTSTSLLQSMIMRSGTVSVPLPLVVLGTCALFLSLSVHLSAILSSQPHILLIPAGALTLKRQTQMSSLSLIAHRGRSSSPYHSQTSPSSLHSRTITG
jgi:hypothetical protein